MPIMLYWGYAKIRLVKYKGMDKTVFIYILKNVNLGLITRKSKIYIKSCSVFLEKNSLVVMTLKIFCFRFSVNQITQVYQLYLFYTLSKYFQLIFITQTLSHFLSFRQCKFMITRKGIYFSNNPF